MGFCIPFFSVADDSGSFFKQAISFPFPFLLNGVVAISSLTALSVSVQKLQHEMKKGKQIKPFQLR
jgi:hypothetical protein